MSVHESINLAPPDPDMVQGDEQRALVSAMAEFAAVAPYSHPGYTWYAPSYKSWHPDFEMYTTPAAWSFAPDEFKTWLLADWDPRPDPEPHQYGFLRVMASDPTKERGPFEFYARVGTDGSMTYRTENHGLHIPKIDEFIELIGVEPSVFDSTQARGVETFDPAITILSRGMAESERPFSPEQAVKLGRYFIDHKGGDV